MDILFRLDKVYERRQTIAAEQCELPHRDWQTDSREATAEKACPTLYVKPPAGVHQSLITGPGEAQQDMAAPLREQ